MTNRDTPALGWSASFSAEILAGVSRSTYEKIGGGYSATRRADPRIAHLIMSSLADAASIVNVGAGTGSYESNDRRVVAVEPSAVMLEIERARTMPIDEVLSILGGGYVVPVPIPHDCRDGFTRAFWRRPRAYLDRATRAGMSTFAAISDADTENGLQRLKHDLDSGRWFQRYGHLLKLDALDLGYRLVVARL